MNGRLWVGRGVFTWRNRKKPICSTLERCPPDLAADLIDRGIMLAGGGAMLSGLDKLLTEETGLPVFVSEEPLNAVAKGTGVMLQEDSIWTT